MSDHQIRPATPGLDFCFTINAQINAPRSAGKGLGGERLHIPITGGTVVGPNIRGRILPGGSDWPLIREDGTSQITAVYTIELEDGTLVVVRNDGLRASTPDVLARLRARESVDPSDYYFRTAPRFDCPDGPHQWLRERIFIASIAPASGSVVIDVFMVT